jgi:tetratricopeptide (TPR) repeat protein
MASTVSASHPHHPEPPAASLDGLFNSKQGRVNQRLCKTLLSEWNRHLGSQGDAGSPGRLRARLPKGRNQPRDHATVTQFVSSTSNSGHFIVDTFRTGDVASALEEALRLHGEGQFEAAIAVYDRILGDDPDNPDVLQLAGLAALACGQPGRAADLLRKSIAIDPTQPTRFVNLGRALTMLGSTHEAIDHFDRAVAAAPDYVAAWTFRGIALAEAGRSSDALLSFDAALALDASNLQALTRKSDLLRKLMRYDEALSCLQQACTIEPDNIELALDLSSALQDCGRNEESLACVEPVLVRQPQLAAALNNRATALVNLRRHAEALAALDLALAHEPDFVFAWVNRGHILAALDRYPDARENFRHVLEIAPDSASARWNAGLLELSLGNLQFGWKAYESRWRLPKFESRRHAKIPVWLGESDVRGKRVLLWHEQGLGDTLQFCRYAIMVAALGATVVLEVQPSLKRLLEQSFRRIALVIATGEQAPACDFATPLMSLPLVFGTQGDTIPFLPSYLTADPIRIEAWASRLGPRRRKLRIGVTFSGNAAHKKDPERSVPTSHFEALRAFAEICIVQNKLRDGAEAMFARLPDVHFFGDDINDFSDTTALIANLDLVISADTSVAHLAGAMGKPAWILLPAVPDWRWQLNRDDSPWYPSARLFRQQRSGNWDQVFERVTQALEAL